MREEKGLNEQIYDLKCKINELEEKEDTYYGLVLENEEMKREITFLVWGCYRFESACEYIIS